MRTTIRALIAVLLGVVVWFAPSPVQRWRVLRAEAELEQIESMADALALAGEADAGSETSERLLMEPVTRCGRRGARRFCDGTRRIPRPHGEAAQRAATLGLGSGHAVVQLMTHRPEAAWIDAAGAPSHDAPFFPVDGGRLGRGFGYVRHGADVENVRHDGLDIGARVGAVVRAVADGIVGYADNGLAGYGNLVIVVHGDGTTTVYAHLRAARVFAGERVKRGQPIGEVGVTGLTFGPHLHFEWHADGRPRNPMHKLHRAVGRRARADT